MTDDAEAVRQLPPHLSAWRPAPQPWNAGCPATLEEALARVYAPSPVPSDSSPAEKWLAGKIATMDKRIRQLEAAASQQQKRLDDQTEKLAFAEAENARLLGRVEKLEELTGKMAAFLRKKFDLRPKPAAKAAP